MDDNYQELCVIANGNESLENALSVGWFLSLWATNTIYVFTFHERLNLGQKLLGPLVPIWQSDLRFTCYCKVPLHLHGKRKLEYMFYNTHRKEEEINQVSCSSGAIVLLAQYSSMLNSQQEQMKKLLYWNYYRNDWCRRRRFERLLQTKESDDLNNVIAYLDNNSQVEEKNHGNGL